HYPRGEDRGPFGLQVRVAAITEDRAWFRAIVGRESTRFRPRACWIERTGARVLDPLEKAFELTRVQIRDRRCSKCGRIGGAQSDVWHELPAAANLVCPVGARRAVVE